MTLAPGAKIVIDGSGFPTASYGVESSTNFVNWSALSTTTTATNGTFQFTNAVTGAVQFYRAVWME